MAEDDKFHWEPATNPDAILIPGLNTTAPTTDQIEQIDQLITLKLQVSFVRAPLAAADQSKTFDRKSTGNSLGFSGWLSTNSCLRSNNTRMASNQ